MSAQPIRETESDETIAQRVRAVRRGRIETRLDLPPRPRKADRSAGTHWQADAVCAGPDVRESDRRAFVSVQRQADAWPLTSRYCDRCPVAAQCLEDSRNVHSFALAGGLVLDDGHLAPDAPGDAAFRDPLAWTPPWQINLEEIAGEGGASATEAAGPCTDRRQRGPSRRPGGACATPSTLASSSVYPATPSAGEPSWTWTLSPSPSLDRVAGSGGSPGTDEGGALLTAHKLPVAPQQGQ